MNRDPPGAAAPPPVPGPGGVARPPAPRAETDRDRVTAVAQRFFEALVARRSDELAALSRPGFSFEGRIAATAEDVRMRFGEAFARREGAATLEAVEVLTAPEALARLGPPPPKLQKLVHPRAWVAVARISGRPVVAILDRQGAGWVATGIHD